MNYYVYYDDEGHKTIRPFGKDEEAACFFFKSILMEEGLADVEVDPFEAVSHCYEFMPLVWDRPELYGGPVLVVCGQEEEPDEYDYYYDEIKDFIELVEEENVRMKKRNWSPWYIKTDELRIV